MKRQHGDSTTVNDDSIIAAPISHRLDILLVDADAAVGNDCILRCRGHDVTLVGTGREALKRYSTSDIVLLNMTLPDMDAFRVCRTIREQSGVPVIAIVNTEDELDRILALRSGADDCVQKSCGSHEVIARIDAIMGRTRTRHILNQFDDSVLHVDHLTLNVSTREAKVSNQEKILTEKEFDLLEFLMRSHPATASRKEIMRSVWKTDWSGSSRTIDTHVSSLRNKLGSNDWITSVRGVGYRLGIPRRNWEKRDLPDSECADPVLVGVNRRAHEMVTEVRETDEDARQVLGSARERFDRSVRDHEVEIGGELTVPRHRLQDTVR